MQNRFKYGEATLQDFDRAMREYGWVMYENVVEPAVLDIIDKELNTTYEDRRRIQIENGIAANNDGTLHHLLERDNFAMKYLKRLYLHEEKTSFLGGNYILNSFGGVITIKGSKSYAQNAHRDVRTFTRDIKLMLNELIFLDDFTLENGATHLLSGSHRVDAKPTEEAFAKADRAVGKRGTVVLFDSLLWHSAGQNLDGSTRRALTLTHTRPFFKPQFDHPRYLGYEFKESLDEQLKQIIGYNARIPSTLYEWYQPPEKRMYKPGQG